MEYFSLFLLNCKIDLFIQALDKAPAVLRQVILKTLTLKKVEKFVPFVWPLMTQEIAILKLYTLAKPLSPIMIFKDRVNSIDF